jgi:hypothetical protein
MHLVHVLDAGGPSLPGQEERSQREGQLDDDADYQSAYQSVRSTPHMQAHLRPLPALKAGKSRHPTVDGMEEVRGSSPLSSTAKMLVSAYLILRDT